LEAAAMIRATLGLQAAAQQVWDAIVVGAGPAGGFAAHQLARQKVKVLLVDKANFPRWKVCGCCLNGRALSFLQRGGLGSLMPSRGGVPLRQVVLTCRGKSAWLPLSAGMALSREAFDAALIEEAMKAGAAFIPETQARLGYGNSSSRRVILRQGNHEIETTTRLVLAADGLGGRLINGALPGGPIRVAGSRIGVGVMAATGPSCYRDGVIFMACGAGGYVGAVRLEHGRLAVAAAFDPAFFKHAGTPGQAASAILREAGQPPIPAVTEVPWRGTPSFTRRASGLAAHRLFVLGDAAGFVEPFTGEGIAWALASGAAVTPLALRAIRSWEPILQDQWTAEYQGVIIRRQWACRAVASLLRRPRLTHLLVRVLSSLPSLAAPVLGYLNQPVSLLSGNEA
jgi:flavin-dependent dehydrogenase